MNILLFLIVHDKPYIYIYIYIYVCVCVCVCVCVFVSIFCVSALRSNIYPRDYS